MQTESPNVTWQCSSFAVHVTNSIRYDNSLSIITRTLEHLWHKAYFGVMK